MDKTIRGLLFVIAMAVLLVGTAMAIEPFGAQILQTSNNGKFPVAGPGLANITSGNITRANLNTSMDTYRWAGLYGNASGQIVLGDNTMRRFFQWSARSREVYACRVGPAWAYLEDAGKDGTERNFTWINVTNAQNDGYNTTFTGAVELFGSGIYSTIQSDWAGTYDLAGNPIWKTYSLGDRTNPVFAGRVLQNNISYNGDVADYQMILPEDGMGGDETPTGWNLYLELV